MNVFLRELRSYRRSTLIWAVSLSALVLLFLSLFPAFMRDVETMRSLLARLPEVLRTALDIELASFFTIYGFFAYLLSFVTLAGAIQAMNVGTGVLSKEVSGKTADFLLSKPVTRGRIFSAKLAAAIGVIALTDLVFSAVAVVAAMVAAPEGFSIGTFLLLCCVLPLVQLVFLALGALAAVSIPRIKSVVSVSLPAVFGFYIVGMIGDILDSEAARYVSPFKFYDPISIIERGSIDGLFLLFETAIVIAAVALAYVIYVKKDVRAPA